ncbi:carbohydrate ABC transporter permease [Cohnella thailandensis]|uniref:Carbohydrate ABC transporter permease n=1 Tax=Cohnella thailandensis TaxID=557557 RepID=A0A841SYL0_9BACL|nr:carbohydrate ABC transporter permease [Cohnella thailandensis]MBB6637303.1 carbohydrate ABC transporter permease [Cohnella thailandensis]MBP1976631.1 ABC-type glycerol-3-phosphate transport system permease component [Cohnella thailandensis]
MNIREHLNLRQVTIVAILAILVFLTLVPILFMIVSSLKSNAQILGNFWGLPAPARWGNYAEALNAIWRYILNTVGYAVAGSVCVMLLSAVSGYLFAKKTFPGKEVLFLMMLAIMMIPGILTLIPSYVLYENMGLTNTPWVIIVSSAAGGQIFGTFLCRTYMAGLPSELFEAARMDGAAELRVFLRIVVPLSLPILATLFIMQSVGVYNDYIWPLLTIRDSDLQVISVGLTIFTKQFGVTDLGTRFAAYAISSVPLLLIFSFGMKYYIQGMTQGALKM